MAGGMGRRHEGWSLTERAARATPPPPSSVSSPDPSRPAAGQARHCWVIDVPGHPGRWPGLVAEWRKAEPGGSWLGRTVYAVDDDGRAVLVETWVPAEHLEPAT